MDTGSFFSLFRRGQHPIRPVKLTGCEDGYCAIRADSLVNKRGSPRYEGKIYPGGRPLGQDFWNYWKSKGLEMPGRPYAVLEEGHSEGGVAYDDMLNMCPVFRKELIPNYDVGVGIAKGAMVFSYMLDRHGLPMLVVKQHADHSTKDGEATWEPVDTVDKKAIRGKDVLVVDLDVLTGKTVDRAARELRKFRPRKLDLFLMLGPVREYHGNKFGDLEEFAMLHSDDGLDTRTRIPPGLYDDILFFNELKGPEKEPEPRGVPIHYAFA